MIPPSHIALKITRYWLNISLKTKIGFCFGISIFTLSILFSAVIGQSVKQNVEQEKRLLLEQMANQLVNTFDRGIYERYNEIRNISVLRRFTEPSLDKGDRRFLLVKLQQNHRYYSWIGFADTEGVVQVATGELLEGANVKERPWFEGALRLKSVFVGDVHEAKLLAEKLPPLPFGEPLRFIDIATPVYTPEKRLLGVLGAHLSWEWIKDVEKSLTRNIAPEKQISIFIISKEGKIMALLQSV